MSRTVIRMLPDKSGRVCHHFFVHAPAGPAKTPGGAVGPFPFPGSTGYIACQPHNPQVTPQVQGGIIYPVSHTNEARAVTCPKCLATPEWKQTMELIDATLDTAREGMPQTS